MLGKVLVGLIAVAAIAVGGYYYYDSVATPDHQPARTTGDEPSCCRSEKLASPSPCCQSAARAVSTCCEEAVAGVETLSIEPRTVDIESAPQPREAGGQ